MAIDFPGATDDEIDVGNGASLQITGAITIMAWVTLDLLQNTDVVSKQIPADRGFSLQTDDSSPDTYPLFVIAESATVTKSSGWPPSPFPGYGIPTHLAGVFVPSTAIQVWTDAENLGENTTGIPAVMYDPANNVVIGGRPDVGPGFDGKIEDVRIYARALGQAELRTIRAARGQDGIVDGLVSRWLFNEGAEGVAVAGANSVRDVGPNGNHGSPATANCAYAGSNLKLRRAVL